MYKANHKRTIRVQPNGKVFGPKGKTAKSPTPKKETTTKKDS